MAVVQLDAEDRQPENGFVSPETASQELLTRIDGSVLPFLGGFGRYQKQLIVLTWIPALFIGFSQYSNNFLLAQPNNTCIQPLANLTNHAAGRSSWSDGPKNSSDGARPASLYDDGSYGSHNDTSGMQCACSEWSFELHTGLAQNVVTKVSAPLRGGWVGWGHPSHHFVRVMHARHPTPALTQTRIQTSGPVWNDVGTI